MTIRQSALVSSLILFATAGLIGCGGGDTPTADEQFTHEEGPPLQFDEYQVLFTNPTCATYEYSQEVRSENGNILTQKPKDVFCTYDDIGPSGSREQSPQHKLISWIDDPQTTDIFFTALSFSNSSVSKALCSALGDSDRDVTINFVLDNGSDTSRANDVLTCASDAGKSDKVHFFQRGHADGIGYAHNKLVLINPGADTMKIAFGSGNMSSGLVVHHENWHFITLPSATYFAQEHICLMKAELDDTASSSKSAYQDFLDSCIGQIEYKQEGNIKAFFVPGDSGAASDKLMEQLRGAETVDVAAHRFTYTTLMKELRRLQDSYQVPVRLVADDDMYWAGHGQQVGDNMSFEYYNAQSLVDGGGQVKWMETNHDMHLLHHNKFLIIEPYFHWQKPGVWCGAGNLTGTGFHENWENLYWIEIPEVVEAYRAQYQHLWNDLATAPGDMPTENVMP